MLYDKIIIGAGIYGLYSALFCGKRDERVLILEFEDEPFKRATYINQARVHMGYHYPRSYSTAIKSAKYFERFNKDYSFCINSEFTQIYATASNFSWSNSAQFEKFCKAVDIMCDSISPTKYFKNNMCDGSFITKEYTYDAQILKKYFLNEIEKYKNIEIKYNSHIEQINKDNKQFEIILDNGQIYNSPFVLNVTYASINQILNKLNYNMFKIKYELCEIILCSVSEKFKDVGITVMDGPFFSIMPFGKTGYHSLTSVTFTPHNTSYDYLPTFQCQLQSDTCSPYQLDNCNACVYKPKTAWPYMSSLAKKYLKDEYYFRYEKSLFSVKPILKTSEIDDSRPTIIRKFSNKPTFISVLSGKINTVYDLDEVLRDG